MRPPKLVREPVSFIMNSRRPTILLVAVLCALSACRRTQEQRYFERTDLPEQVVPFYDEAAAFKALGTSDKKEKVDIDLAFLVQDSKIENALIVQYDQDNWYEPMPVKLAGSKLQADLQLNRDFVVVLDLGEIARNNYLAVSQLGAARGLIPAELHPKFCKLILCSPNRFQADTIVELLPAARDLRIDLKNVLPSLPVGPVGRPGHLCDTCFEKITNILPCLIWRCGDFPIRRSVFVRRNIYSLSAAAITSLRAGVAAMKARSDSDPTSWLYQAKMHAVDSGTVAALQDQCQHRQFFFFSWHRMFTYYFERILRKSSGDPKLTLPYWNYTDVPAQAVLPEPYRLPADATNSLYNSTRQAVYNGGVALPAADVSYSAAFNLTNFTTPTLGAASFGGRTLSAPAHFPSSAGSGGVEKSPHNNVHNDINGEMATGESPRDPIFWLHHSNIDRLWKRWLALGNGRVNPTGDSVWMNHVFTFFDENGAQVSLTGAQVLNTVTQLNYRYDDDPLVFWDRIPWKVAMLAEELKPLKSEAIMSIKNPVLLGDARQDVPLPVPDESRNKLARSLDTKFEKERLVLQLRNIDYDQPVGITYLVFLNLPADARNPDHTHPNFIGTLGFFGKHDSPNHEHGDEGLTEDYDITAVVRKTGSLDDLRLTFIPSLPTAPADRKDLQELIARMKPQGNPRFGEVVLLRLASE